MGCLPSSREDYDIEVPVKVPLLSFVGTGSCVPA